MIEAVQVLRSKIGKVFFFAASYAALLASEALLAVCGPLSGCIFGREVP
jgi:hypothetical protein